MLTPEYLDTLPDTLVSLWQRVEDDILRDIARRIGKMDTVTAKAIRKSDACCRRPEHGRWPATMHFTRPWGLTHPT